MSAHRAAPRAGHHTGPRHAAHRTVPTRSRPRRTQLLIVVAAPLSVLLALTANAATRTPAHPTTAATHAHASASKAKGVQPRVAAATAAYSWRKGWSPALALLSNYTKGQRSQAGFLALPLSMAVAGSQEAIGTATFRTRWVDVKALHDGPNIAQQGLSIQPNQFKLQIAHGSTPASHRGDCHVAGHTGHILAYGPSIDVADGNWHTITCIKYPDSARGTKVVVIVDGVAGRAYWSRTPIGNVTPLGEVRLGGRSTLASTDSLDGWISKLAFRTF